MGNILGFFRKANESLGFGKKKRKRRGTAERTNPKLWDKVVAEVKRGGKGGRPGQWSARKAQLAVQLYKKRGGGYKGRRRSDNHLHKWTRQNWRTKSGRPSVVGKRASGERYLPAKAIRKLSDREYKKTSAAKRRANRSGRQYSKQPKSIARKTKRYRS